MYVSMFQVVLVYAALTVAASYEEKDMTCSDNGLLVPSFKVCDGVYDCRQWQAIFWIAGSQDEDPEVCAPQDVRTREPVFTSLTQPNGSLLLSWTWSVPPSSDLAGYYLRGTFSDHVFQITLSPLLSEYMADCLRGYTQYTITLRPFYKNDGRTKLGKAALLTVGSLFTVTPHEEKDMRCRDNHELVPSFKVCDGVLDCRERYDPYGFSHSEDENPEICALDHIHMHELNFTSLSHPDGSLLLSWTWSVPPSSDLAGYYLRGTSSDHTFQTTLSPLLSEYTAECLTRYSQYNITLRPFYVDVDGQLKLGRAALLSVRSPATAPEAPREIGVHSQSGIEQGSAGELAVTIFEPISWNSNPVGFRLRWEQNDQRNEGARDFDLPVNKTGSKTYLYAKLPLKPGRTYTLFASARGVGHFGEVLVGPETSITAETVPEANNRSFTLAGVEKLLDEAIALVTAENWARNCAHVVRLEEEAWEQDGAIESTLDSIIITLGCDSSSCSDSSVSELSGIKELMNPVRAGSCDADSL
ncbi:uncharacterized protein LOC119393481 [Rhipicephalus sanguineus]|uniref:uncharacterized protein LOC119393481 n=1 Tax=Rhipicephalus sanguineus TaxID=34632 RepID=UPI0020C40452|nr:uncharacterized protein LOC119393481 [Rhipicephalus sanguineus]